MFVKELSRLTDVQKLMDRSEASEEKWCKNWVIIMKKQGGRRVIYRLQVSILYLLHFSEWEVLRENEAAQW